MAHDKKVDFHSHYLSPTYYEYLDRFEDEKPDSFPTPKWSLEEHLALMDRFGVAFSLISVSSPNLSRADRETEKTMVHQINIEGKGYVDQYPDRLGLFAGLPLPHVEDALEEATFALDELNCDGFSLTTNYAGMYLGDPALDPLMRFLNDRNAVVAIHPTKPAGLPQGVNEDVPIPAMEFLIDTTRTFTFMVMNNLFERFPQIRWIFPHAGAFVSFLSDRMNGFAVLMKQDRPDLPLDFHGNMKHVYYDVAGFPLQKQLQALLKDVKIDNLLYGSDTPYTPELACAALSGGLEDIHWLSDEEKVKLFCGNAAALIPRLEGILEIDSDGKGISYAEHPLTRKEKRNRRRRALISKLYGILFNNK